jgi:hypothetical protein
MKAVKEGLNKLLAEVKHWKSEVELFPSEDNISELQNVEERLDTFKKSYQYQIDTIEKYPFLAE